MTTGDSAEVYYFGTNRDIPHPEEIEMDVEGETNPVRNSNTVIRLYYVGGLAVFDHCELRTLQGQAATFQLDINQLAVLVRRKFPLEFHPVPDNGTIMDINTIQTHHRREEYGLDDDCGAEAA